MSATWSLPTLAATEGLGKALAQHCPWGLEPRVVYLSGELGAGKTTLAAAAIQSLGIEEPVRSPSYALVECYPVGARQAVHVDLYRLRGADELEQLGLRDYLTAQTLFFIEWPERAPDALPAPDLSIGLETVPIRQASLQACGPSAEAWLTAILTTLRSQVES
jgi:tRNA threonylcarbamoyladenosine biosynthesis protein TsaE